MTDPAQASPVSVVLEIGSALFGIYGTYLMSRRYTTSLAFFLVLALFAPIMFALGRGKVVHDYYENRTLANRDVPIATNRMALGLSLLCWAFFFQLLQVLIG